MISLALMSPLEFTGIFTGIIALIVWCIFPIVYFDCDLSYDQKRAFYNFSRR